MLKPKKIVLTGPESVGKSTLTKQLAVYFNAPFGTELARAYVENLQREYNIDDVLEIAKLQIAQERRMMISDSQFVFFDTDLIITKKWLLHLYNECPKWIDDYLEEFPADLHLLCYYDILWENDPVRENQDIRPELYEAYKSEIERLGIGSVKITGQGELRLSNAIFAVKKYFEID